MTNFNIQIISDTVCPWCYVGYRRLSRAIVAHRATHPTDTFNITWKAFYLNPASPQYPGVNKQEMYSMKFGAERSAAMFKRLSAVGESDGISFKFGGNTGSTRDSHRLLWYAGEQEAEANGKKGTGAEIGGIQTRVAEKLFKAYFEDEKNITDVRILEEAGVESGLARGSVKGLLDSEDGGAEVDGEAKMASRRLVSGVPYFEVQGKYCVEGADEPETFLEIFEKIKETE
ncbi:hypothetical protein N7476_009510 [Penicillium atrosanguineum]|uniref:DSBA-like thioredoxin domain-containing protein n=1 Tax=Penicillium atrosanguineum TaxID=1132637 RepID=A0A9W9PND6_9EURO|nr:hypothetical protein N7476_009510 [Penicillium atrosanguineum]